MPKNLPDENKHQNDDQGKKTEPGPKGDEGKTVQEGKKEDQDQKSDESPKKDEIKPTKDEIKPKKDENKTPVEHNEDRKSGSELNEDIARTTDHYNILMFVLKILGIITLIGLLIFVVTRLTRREFSHVEFVDERHDEEARIPSPQNKDAGEVSWQGINDKL